MQKQLFVFSILAIIFLSGCVNNEIPESIVTTTTTHASSTPFQILEPQTDPNLGGTQLTPGNFVLRKSENKKLGINIPIVFPSDTENVKSFISCIQENSRTNTTCLLFDSLIEKYGKKIYMGTFYSCGDDDFRLDVNSNFVTVDGILQMNSGLSEGTEIEKVLTGSAANLYSDFRFTTTDTGILDSAKIQCKFKITSENPAQSIEKDIRIEFIAD